MIRIPRDWSEFVDALISHRAKFLIIGAHALAAHGRPRYSGDFDVFVEPSRRNAERVAAAMRDFGFSEEDADAAWLAAPDHVVQMGVPPMRLDILTGIDGVTFDEAWRGRILARFNDRTVGVIGRAEFIKNKRASGKKRPKDLLDLALLEEVEAPAPLETRRNLSEYQTPRRPGSSAPRGRPSAPRGTKGDE